VQKGKIRALAFRAAVSMADGDAPFIEKMQKMPRNTAVADDSYGSFGSYGAFGMVLRYLSKVHRSSP
jgi:hypothetical protein